MIILSKYQKIKLRVFEIIEAGEKDDIPSKVFDVFIIFLIVVNLFVIFIETFSIPDNYRNIIYAIEIFSVIVFTIEYLLRIWTAPLLFPEKSPAKARLKYIFSFMAIIDLLAILPFYIPYIIPIDLRVLRAFRVIRLFRIFKINRYTHALSMIAQVFKNKASQLISSVLVVALLMMIASVLMYNIEYSEQPEAFSNAFDTMWWAVATLTTVGYGDIYPVTVAGKLLSTVIAFLGIGMVAVPTGIITAGFTELTDKNKNEEKDEKNYCPYCGHKIDD